MKLLIIGSKGFIGGHIVNYYISELKYEIWSCDVMVDYTTKRYIQVDATNSEFSDIFINHKFNICINCSGAASVPDSLIHPQRDFLLNTYNVFRILDAIRKYNPECRFVNMSSAAVYGNSLTLPIKESFLPCPISPYGKHKLMSENICKEYFEFFGIRTCSLRIFSAFGEGLKKQLLWDLFVKMQYSPVLKLFGNGTETRDYIYIYDIACAIDLIIDNTEFKGETINVANGKEILIKDIVELFSSLMNWQGEIIFSGYHRPGDPFNWQADITTIESYGYVPTITFEDGAKKFVKWAKENI